MSPIPVLKTLDQLWGNYASAPATTAPATKAVPRPEDSNPPKGRACYELKYDENDAETLKYNVELHGQQPANGYPLFIGFHGGGGPPNETPAAKLTSICRMTICGNLCLDITSKVSRHICLVECISLLAAL